jgi:hypothetical protein
MNKIYNFAYTLALTLYILLCTNLLVVCLGLWILTVVIPYIPAIVLFRPLADHIKSLHFDLSDSIPPLTYKTNSLFS